MKRSSLWEEFCLRQVPPKPRALFRQQRTSKSCRGAVGLCRRLFCKNRPSQVCLVQSAVAERLFQTLASKTEPSTQAAASKPRAQFRRQRTKESCGRRNFSHTTKANKIWQLRVQLQQANSIERCFGKHQTHTFSPKNAQIGASNGYHRKTQQIAFGAQHERLQVGGGFRRQSIHACQHFFTGDGAVGTNAVSRVCSNGHHPGAVFQRGGANNVPHPRGSAVFAQLPKTAAGSEAGSGAIGCRQQQTVNSPPPCQAAS